MKKQTGSNEIQIIKIEHERATFRILGDTPFILNRMSEKTMRTLLCPAPGKKNAAEKAATLKHDPKQEFLNSPYVDSDPKGPTYLQHLCSAFKKGMMGAAIDLPNTKKAQIGRLLWVENERFSLYGIPKMKMDGVRNSDVNRTPDVRTRMIVPQWACEITINYQIPLLRATGVANLLAAAGMTQGIGDWRIELGGTFGRYRFVGEADPEWKRIVKIGGRRAQIEAIENFDFYDEETEELYNWFLGEVSRRGMPSENGKPRRRRPTAT